MPSKVASRVSSAAKRASNRASKGVSKTIKSMKSMNSEQIVIGVLLVILVVLVIYYVNQNTNERFDNKNSEPAVLYLFYVDWCPHCKSAKPQVAELEKELAKNNNKINNTNVVVKQVNCEGSDEEKALAKENNVRAYPTVVLKNGDNTVEYEKGVSAKGLNEFLEENL